MRTLIVVPQWVGDCVMALPVIEALAASGRDLVVLARQPLHPLLRLAPGVGELVERDADDRATVERLRAARCEEAVLLQGSVRAARLAKQAGIRYRWGYAGALHLEALLRRPLPHVGRFVSWAASAPLRTALLAPPVPHPATRRRPQVEDFRELLAAMGVAPPSSWVPKLELSPAVRAGGAERLARGHVEVGRGPIVGLFPGAEFGPAKRWPWRRFAELAHELRRAVPGAQNVIIAGPKEVWLAVRVHEESGKIHPVIGPDLDLAGLAAVLAHLELLVTNDSGPMHLAAALGVRCVALFGPTDARRTAPAGEGHQVLGSQRWCVPCLRRRCPLLHQGCLRDTTVEQVLAACRTAIDERASATAGQGGKGPLNL